MPAEDRAPTRRLPREQRREQILVAATEALADKGFAATSLDDLAEAAGVSRMILYRHFESKQDLCQAVLDRATLRLLGATEVEIGTASVQALLAWAAAEPAAFRVLFQHAAHQPEFAGQARETRTSMVAEVHHRLAGAGPGTPWTRWAANLATSTCLEAITAWLDVGAPDPAEAAERITAVIDSIVRR